ncbi:MAG: hypothetical protein M1831_001814 [Alyxoria varia]|nr:MAG: hypothetical protein M1831_001814 [Alyxoria varia]
MASATVLHYHQQPASFSDLGSSTPLNPNAHHGRSFAPTSPFVSSLVASTKDSSSNDASLLASSATKKNASAAARHASTASRLGKVNVSKTTRRRQKSDALHYEDEHASSRAISHPPLTERPGVPSRNSAKSTSRDKLKQNLRKFSQNKDDNSTSLDLSRTAAENQERSGLAINSPSSGSPLVSETGVFHNAPLRAHGRTHSGTSFQSNISGSFKPTTPFTLQMKPSPRPYTPPTEFATATRSSSALSDNFDHPSGGVRPSESTDWVGARPTEVSKPTLWLNTDDRRLADSPQPSMSQSFYPRSRRDTNRSVETTTSSRPSVDRSMGFVRGVYHPSSKNSPVVDDSSRQASIQAARQAFTEREEAKARRYDRMEKKAAEKKEKSKTKQHGHGRENVNEAGRDKPKPQGLGIAASQSCGDLGAMSTTDTATLDGRVDSPDCDTQSVPHLPLSKKRTAQRNYVGFKTWLKIRMMNLRNRKRRGKSS